MYHLVCLHVYLPICWDLDLLTGIPIGRNFQLAILIWTIPMIWPFLYLDSIHVLLPYTIVCIQPKCQKHWPSIGTPYVSAFQFSKLSLGMTQLLHKALLFRVPQDRISLSCRKIEVQWLQQRYKWGLCTEEDSNLCGSHHPSSAQGCWSHPVPQREGPTAMVVVWGDWH